jgi:hypothetical protein
VCTRCCRLCRLPWPDCLSRWRHRQVGYMHPSALVTPAPHRQSSGVGLGLSCTGRGQRGIEVKGPRLEAGGEEWAACTLHLRQESRSDKARPHGLPRSGTTRHSGAPLAKCSEPSVDAFVCAEATARGPECPIATRCRCSDALFGRVWATYQHRWTPTATRPQTRGERPFCRCPGTVTRAKLTVVVKCGY